MTVQPKKNLTNKQFVSEVAKIMNKGQVFDGDISKQVLLKKLKKKYGLVPCPECGVFYNYHKSECSEVRDSPLR